MHQQRRPSKRYSSYVPPSELSSLEDRVMLMPANSENAECEPSKNQRSSSTGSAEASARRPSFSTLHFDALQNAVSQLARIDDFHLEELGYGFFSDVFKVTHKQSGKIMVLKRNKSTNTKLNILREVQLMNRLSHPNILKFMGVCVHEGQLHGLTEFINGGDLDQFVQKWSTPISWRVRTNLALDVSRGVGYLHSMNIFHRDLTAKNCLVRETEGNKGKTRYSAVVADLGLAEKIPSTPEEESKLKVVGTPYYMAPEVLMNKPYNQISDIFSFGIILCQLIIRTPSDPEKLPRSNDFGIARDLLLAMVTKGEGAPVSPTGKPIRPPNSFLQLMFDCCEVDAAKRPSVPKIVQLLQKTLSALESEKQERKRLEGKKHSPVAKRHSAVLSELPSFSAVCPKPHEGAPPSIKTGSNKENGPTPLEPSIPHKENPSTAKAGRRRSSESRLSRSYSDISSEIISHAKSIIASSREKMATEATDSDMHTVVDTLNEAFFNPFDRFEISEDQGKLFDDPSSDVLEMTFDLPTPKLIPGSPARVRRAQMRNKYRRRPSRPKSLVIVEQEVGVAMDQESGKSTHDSHSAHGFPSSWPQSPVTPEPLQNPLQRGPMSLPAKLKQAIMRSIALSPQGCRLLSWWQCHGRGSDMKSISSVFSLMSDKYGKLQRSISLPNIAMMRENMFVGTNSPPNPGSPPLTSNHKPPNRCRYHNPPSYVTLPRRKSRNITPEITHKKRSSTSDDVFHDKALEILHEESQNTQEPPRTAPGTLPRETGPGIDVNDALNPAAGKTEINNNIVTSSVLDTQKKIAGVNGRENENEEWNTGNTAPHTPAPSTNAELKEQFRDVETPPSSNVKSTPGGACSSEGSISSSSSSGASSSALKITLQTGVICSNRRKKVGPTMSQPLEENEVTPRSNRDSGYNDDVNISDHSHPYCDPAGNFHPLPATIEPTSPMYAAPLTPKRGCSTQKCLDLEGSMSDLTLMTASDLIGSPWKVGDPKSPQKQVYQMR